LEVLPVTVDTVAEAAPSGEETVDDETVAVEALEEDPASELPLPPLLGLIVVQLGQVTTKFQLVPLEFTKEYEYPPV
jgi:hypothetical protein